LGYYKQCKQIAKEISSPPSLVEVAANMGFVHIRLENFQEAVTLIQANLDRNRLLENPLINLSSLITLFAL